MQVLATETTTLQVPKQFPMALLVASGFYYVQNRIWNALLKKQADVMGRPAFGKMFDQSH